MGDSLSWPADEGFGAGPCAVAVPAPAVIALLGELDGPGSAAWDRR